MSDLDLVAQVARWVFAGLLLWWSVILGAFGYGLAYGEKAAPWRSDRLGRRREAVGVGCIALALVLATATVSGLWWTRG